MSNNVQDVTANLVKRVTSNFVLVGVDVRSISGTVSAEDRVAGNDKQVFTSGSVRYISPIVLRPFASARMAAARLCRTHGTRFWGAWAVPEQSLDELIPELEKIATFVNNKREDLLDTWGSELAQWETVHPAAAAYRSRFPSRKAAEDGIGIAISFARIAHTGQVIKGADDAIGAEVKGMPMRVLEEIAQDVRDSWSPGAKKATQASKGLLRRVANKCRTLSFVGGNLGEVADFVEQTINRLPLSGEITGNDFLVLSGVLSLLERPEVIASGNFHFTAAVIEDEPGAEEGGGEAIAGPEISAPAPATKAISEPESAYAW